MTGDRPDRGNHSSDAQLVTLGELWHVEDRIGSRIADVKTEMTAVRDEFEAYAVGHEKVHRAHSEEAGLKYDDIMARSSRSAGTSARSSVSSASIAACAARSAELVGRKRRPSREIRSLIFALGFGL